MAPLVTCLRDRIWPRLPRRLRQWILWRLNSHFVVGAVALIRDEAGRVLIARRTHLGQRPWGIAGRPDAPRRGSG